MCPVAERGAGGLLAGAEIDGAALRGFPLLGQEVRAFAQVGTVAEGLVLRLAAGAPEVGLAGHDLDRPTWDALCDDLVHLMRIGVRRGRIDTLRPEHEPLRARGAKRNYVYRRAGEPCLVCGTVVRTEVLATRNLFWCPTCQGTDSLRG